jgi:hypothetical protein
METTLFLALGVLALLAYREKRWAWLGVSLGLLALTRPEGLALAVAIGLIDVWRNRGVQRGLLATMLITVLICGPWFGYLYWRTGHIIPTSGIGKRLSITIGIRLVTSEVGFLSTLGQHPALIYPALWLVYILEFVLGGMALPPPRIPAGAILGRPEYTFSIWALAGLAGVILPLVWVFASLLARPRRWKRWIAHGARRPIVVLAAWAIIHNLVYMIVLPSTGTASRYGAINHLVLWLVLAIGLFIVARRSRLWPWMAGGLAIIALANTLYWNGVYDANIEHMKNVRIAAARFIGENLARRDLRGVRYRRDALFQPETDRRPVRVDQSRSWRDLFGRRDGPLPGRKWGHLRDLSGQSRYNGGRLVRPRRCLWVI